MFFRSIRFKMMLWYMLLLTITLLIFSVFLYGGFNKILFNELDDLLCARAEGAADAAHIRLEERRKDPELMSIYVRILDDRWQELMPVRPAPRFEALPAEIMDDVMEGEESFDILKGLTSAGKKASFRVYTKPVMENNTVKYIVQAAGPTNLLSLASKNLILVLFILLPLTVLLAGIPGILLVRLTLKPVDVMIKTIRQTTAENLKLRIHIPDTKDEIKRLADTFNDMTERLDRSFSSQQNFIQDISSELRAPIESLKERFNSDETEKVVKILSDLETLAKFDNSGYSLEIRKVDLSRLLGEILEEMKPRAGERGVAVTSVLSEVIVMDADSGRLKQLFVNIIDNAIKFTLRKGKITVTAHKDKNFATVAVSDTGIGMEENELPYIFDRFYQVNKNQRSSGSFGLGLSIAKSALDAHKGTIAVDSKPGAGTTFTVKLPLKYSG